MQRDHNGSAGVVNPRARQRAFAIGIVRDGEHREDPLAELILSGKVKDGEKVEISAGRQGITFNGVVAQAA